MRTLWVILAIVAAWVAVTFAMNLPRMRRLSRLASMRTLEVDQGDYDDLIEEFVTTSKGATGEANPPITTAADLVRAVWRARSCVSEAK